MKKSFERLLDLYDYEFPQDLIAQEPVFPRDSAKLLVYDKQKNKAAYDTFKNLAKYLPQKAVLVFNETKVIPARLAAKKETGGKVNILYLSAEGKELKVMADRKLPAGGKIFLSDSVFFTVSGQKEKYYFLRPSFSVKKLYGVLEKYGAAPLPPYIKHSPLTKKQLKEKYQAVFARHKGSVAAPTASLHFTGRSMRSLRKSGFDVCFVTLHVNLGTFAPLEEKNIKEKKLHKEFYQIDKKTADFLNRAKKEGRPIIGVGTTAVRALESAARFSGKIDNLSGITDIFIEEGYKSKFTDGIVTNFHVPRSSLLMLVSAFAGRKRLLKLYRQAIQRKFRLFSFGDGMLIV